MRIRRACCQSRCGAGVGPGMKPLAKVSPLRRCSFRFPVGELQSYSDAFLRALAGAPADAVVVRAPLSEVRYGEREASAIITWLESEAKACAA